ncbi:hypothetical protein M6C30_11330 [Escherichia coli]|nr:hypothetical protein [Escherichia coli]
MKLKMQDLRLFNIVFESDPGWILDFSNRTLSAFFDEELNIDSKRKLTAVCSHQTRIGNLDAHLI